MMTPDTRPIGVLTPAILTTASHWCIRWGDNALTVPAREVTIFSTVIDAYGLTFGSGSDSKTTCYPCTLQPNGLVVPEPWPVLDGEEEIEHMRGVSADYVPHYRQSDGTHLSPRKGKTGIVWVWEKDRC